MQSSRNSSVKFADELQKVAETEDIEIDNNISDNDNVKEDGVRSDSELSDEQESQVDVTKDIKSSIDTQKDSKNDRQEGESNKDQYVKSSAIKLDGNLRVDTALEDLNIVVKEFTQSDEKISKPLKPEINKVDTKEKGENLINNDLNITENKEILPQMLR